MPASTFDVFPGLAALAAPTRRQTTARSPSTRYAVCQNRKSAPANRCQTATSGRSLAQALHALTTTVTRALLSQAHYCHTRATFEIAVSFFGQGTVQAQFYSLPTLWIRVSHRGKPAHTACRRSGVIDRTQPTLWPHKFVWPKPRRGVGVMRKASGSKHRVRPQAR